MRSIPPETATVKPRIDLLGIVTHEALARVEARLAERSGWATCPYDVVETESDLRENLVEELRSRVRQIGPDEWEADEGDVTVVAASEGVGLEDGPLVDLPQLTVRFPLREWPLADTESLTIRVPYDEGRDDGVWDQKAVVLLERVDVGDAPAVYFGGGRCEVTYTVKSWEW